MPRRPKLTEADFNAILKFVGGDVEAFWKNNRAGYNRTPEHYDSASSFLNDAFSWANTPENSDYWSKLHDDIHCRCDTIDQLPLKDACCAYHAHPLYCRCEKGVS